MEFGRYTIYCNNLVIAIILTIKYNDANVVKLKEDLLI